MPKKFSEEELFATVEPIITVGTIATNRVFTRVSSVPPEEGSTHVQESILSIFDSEEKFLGQFECAEYTLFRGYVHGNGKLLRLYYTRLEPLLKSNQHHHKATICIIHGFGEHSGRFLHIADSFAKAGCVVQLIDLRGFGYSGGARGASTMEELHNDIQTLLSQANRELPLYLFGHSLGGQLVLSLAIRNRSINFAGIITTSALIGFPKDRQMSPLKAGLVKFLGKRLEDVVVNSMIHPTALTKNDNYVKKCFGDRLMIPFLGLNMARNILVGTEFVLPNAYKFDFPCLIIHGMKDMVTSHEDSIAFYNKCSSVDKTLKLFEHGYHEMQHDVECDELVETIKNWVITRAAKAKPFGLLPHVKCGLAKQKETSIARKMFIITAIIVYMIALKKLHGQRRYRKSLLKWLISPLFALIAMLRAFI